MTYIPAVKPYKHQIQALDAVQKRPDHPAPTDVFAFLMEQGTGKSKVVLDEFGAREEAKDLRNLLVVAPSGVYRNWQLKEIPEHLSPALRKRTMVASWISGAGVTHKRELERFLSIQDHPRILLVNVEALSTVQAAVDLCQTFMQQRRTMMVVDESTRIKGLAERTARAGNVIALGKYAVARRIATGLVAPQSPLDLYSQFEFLDYRILGFQSFYAFRHRYAIIVKETFGAQLQRDASGKVMVDREGVAIRSGGREVSRVVGYRNEEELAEKIKPYSFRVLKEDCLDLPKKIYMPPREVNLTDEQARVLKELKKNAMAELDSGAHITTTMKMTTMLRMHQVLCGHVRDEDGKEHGVKSKRLDQLMEVLGEHSGKAIIWSGFRFCIKEIIERLKKEYGPKSTVDFYGDTKQSDRNTAVRRFQEDADCRFFVANQQSAGMGITLTKASLVVYYSNTWSLEDRLQSEDRAHRAGLAHPVTYIDLNVPGSVEDKLIHALRKKLDLATAISGDSYREWII